MLLEVKHTYKGKLEDFALISTEWIGYNKLDNKNKVM